MAKVVLVQGLFLGKTEESGAEKEREARLELRSWVVPPNWTSHARLTRMCVHVWLGPRPLVRLEAKMCVFRCRNLKFDT